MNRIVSVIGLVAVLAMVNWSIFAKEKHLSEGRSVYLKLAPVDPRSLMQGDYMALRFEVANQIYNALPDKRQIGPDYFDAKVADGFVVVRLDERGVGTFVRLDDASPLGEGEMRIQYRVRSNQVKFATNAFFFQEGQGERYQEARFGQFRVSDDGEPLLVSMHADNLDKL